MDSKHHTVSSIEHAAKPDKKTLTTDDIINDIKRLFNDHLNDYIAQLVQERKEHAITKQCLAELKVNQEEILRSYEERFVNQEEKLKVCGEQVELKERFIDENNWKINELYNWTKVIERENKHYKGMCMISIGITMALCGIFFFIRK